MTHPDTSHDTTPTDADGPHPARRPLFGTILWGVLLLAFAALMVVLAIPTITVDPVTLTISALLVVGVFLMVAGVAAWLRSVGRRKP